MESSERSRHGEATRGKRGEADKEGKCTPNADVRRVIDPKHAVLRPPPCPPRIWLTSLTLVLPSFLPNESKSRKILESRERERKEKKNFIVFIDLLNEIRLEVSIDFGTSFEEVEWKGG